MILHLQMRKLELRMLHDYARAQRAAGRADTWIQVVWSSLPKHGTASETVVTECHSH